MKTNFIKCTNNYNSLEKHVAAPYIRKSFVSDSETTASVTVAACGFYELYVNSRRYTKGFLAPYISNTEHYIYYDEYKIPLNKGENVIGLILGNGFQNNPGGYIWDFDKSSFRSAPMVAVSVIYTNANGEKIEFLSDSSFKAVPSPIISDDYRFGETYDARYEIPGWNEPGFDDFDWINVMNATPPCGELKRCEAYPIVPEYELKPVNILKCDDGGYIYDFGEVNAGVCRLSINGEKGQKIEFQHTDLIKDGDIYVPSIWFVRDFWERDKNLIQKDTYICKGGENEKYTPFFTYHGFRYVKVTGITPEQATEELLTYVVLHSAAESRGDFRCSDETVNKLQEITRRSDLSNYHYFPTDCPQREKNGWTADAALSCEQMLLNFNPEANYKEWLCNIRKAQKDDGRLPGIVPTSGWGYEWGNGPAWDCILVYIPYYVYIYRGETDMIRESADAFISYLKYIQSRTDDNGIIHIGLGDWCQVDGVNPPTSPLELTDSVMSMDIADKMAFLFDAVRMEKERDFASSVADNYRKAIRENLIDFDTMTVIGNCQTSQAMCLYYGVFEETEEAEAFNRLLEFIHEKDDHIDVGVLGGRVIFHVLSHFGHSELAFKMIARPDYPSYGNWIERGATTLWESFYPEGANPDSKNHHFWGDISAWFIKRLAGINLNPCGNDINCVDIKPSFVKALDNAAAYHISPGGKISSSWERTENSIILTVEVPERMSGKIILEKGFCFEDGTNLKQLNTGKYVISRKDF